MPACIIHREARGPRPHPEASLNGSRRHPCGAQQLRRVCRCALPLVRETLNMQWVHTVPNMR
eukprot:1132272-Alexandrium_andersonii.AAC.1